MIRLIALHSILPNVTGMIAGGYYSAKFIEHDSGEFDLQPYKMVRHA